MLNIVTFFWGTKYESCYVDRLAAAVKRHINQPYRFICMTERERDVVFADGIERHAIKDPDLIGRGCFARLRLFDPAWQARRQLTERIVCLDLDVIITGDLDPLFDRPEPFVILQGVNTSNPNPMNASVIMLRAGMHPEIWTDFIQLSMTKTDLGGVIPHHEFPDDQGWYWHKIPKAAAWTARDGVYAFQKKCWPKGENLPNNARLVAFPGHRDPKQFIRLNWIADNWFTDSIDEAAA